MTLGMQHCYTKVCKEINDVFGWLPQTNPEVFKTYIMLLIFKSFHFFSAVICVAKVPHTLNQFIMLQDLFKIALWRARGISSTINSRKLQQSQIQP